MKRLLGIRLLPVCMGILSALPGFAQTGNFTTVNLTSATSGATILSAPASGRQEIALSNDFITGVDRITVNDNGLGEGLIFATGEVDISMPNSADDGFAGFMFRTNSTNPFFFHSSGDANLTINSSPGGANLFNTNINFGINRTPSYSIRYNNATNNTGHRLNLVNSATGKGFHIGAEDIWIDKNLQIRSASGGGLSSTRGEILFHTGGTVGSPGATNASVYHSTFPSFGSNMLHMVKDNGFGVHISPVAAYFGETPGPGSNSVLYETYNFVGATKTTRLLIGEFSQPTPSRFPTDASFLLAVDGRSISTGAWISIRSQWPDYVFDKDYTLPRLEDINDYVKKNRHLPEVPTEDAVKESGINMGEMHIALLKKVEEITLHIIDVNERLKNLEAENKKLSDQLNSSK